MADRELVWVVTGCNTSAEAAALGKALLKQRLVACFDVYPRLQTFYYWPPKSGKVEKGKGALLVGVTLPKLYRKAQRYLEEHHSDDTPFVGAIEVEHVSKEYYLWLKSELSN